MQNQNILDELRRRFDPATADRIVAGLEGVDVTDPVAVGGRLRELFADDLAGLDSDVGEPSTTEETDTANKTDDRDERGRFKPGNQAARRNPHTRKLGRLRTAFTNACSREKVAELADKLHSMAMDGDTAAATLWLSYAIGKPRPCVDPDSLDSDELRRVEQSPTQGELAEMLRVVPSDAALILLRLHQQSKADPQAILQGLGEAMDTSEMGGDGGKLAREAKDARRRRPRRTKAES